ncbi:MAG: hypothetical protein IPL71_05770 [Anaerolineales bacterium]|uniref:hypothetical protein n=1 Tax=Candidatus Villigracilis proximus TaxID=3140683 RepID=UPI00313663C6|nr:hypothetical protein [Anaerolineales bacterium]
MTPENTSSKKYWYRPYEDYRSRSQRRLQADLGVDPAAVEVILHLRRQVVELQLHIRQLEIELTAHHDSQQVRLTRYRKVYYEAIWIELEFQNKGERSMEKTAKINRMAIISFVSGFIVIALLDFGMVRESFPASLTYANTIRAIMRLSVSVEYFYGAVALLTGILALKQIQKKWGRERQNLCLDWHCSWRGLYPLWIACLYYIFGSTPNLSLYQK